MRFILPLLLFVTAPVLFAQDPDPSAKLRAEFERVRGELDKPIRQFQQRYEVELAKLERKAKADGNLALVLAVQQEAKDYATSAAAIPDTFPELERLHGQYESKMVQLGREQGPRLKKLLGSYRRLLQEHQKELTRQDKIKEAVAMNGEVARVETELREVMKQIAEGAPPPRVATRPGSMKALAPDLVALPKATYAALEGLAKGSQKAQEQQKQAVTKLGLPLEVKSKQAEIVFRLVPAGAFTMGSPTDELGRKDNENQVQVTLSKPFYCGKFEVTQGQWEAVMESNPSNFPAVGKDAPVEQVSWEDCQAFLKVLCKKEGVPEGTYRLLTEAQWEYACRVGTSTAFYTGEITSGAGNDAALGRAGWFDRNGGSTTHPVGGKLGNAWGLYDMHGNVWEWCGDWYDDVLGGGADPGGPASGSSRVYRGGSWYDNAGGYRAACRNENTPSFRSYNLGVRLLRTVP